jgi:hypothetical protein
MHRVHRGGIGRCLAAVAQPFAHESNLVGLRRVDAPGGVDQRLAVGAVPDQRRHFDRLLVVEDHVLHEADVVGRKAGVGDLDRLLRGQRLGRLAGRSGLNDRRLLRASAGCGEADKQQRATDAPNISHGIAPRT